MAEILIHPATVRMLAAYKAKPTHGLLLTGSIGLGKTHIASGLADQLLNVDSQPANKAYCLVVSPVKKVITIGQIRELTKFFRLAVPGKRIIKRVAVIQDADAMGTEAQNALLKLLEEPPADSVLLLTSSHALGLLPTVRSRLQTIHVLSPTPESIQVYFESLGYSRITVSQARLQAGENVAAIHALLQKGGEPGQVDGSVQLVKLILGSTTYNRLLHVNELAKQKDDAILFVDMLAHVAAVSIETAAARESLSLKRWYGILRAADTAQRALSLNGNPKLILTDLMLAL